jgi:hypothetical protein
MTRRSPRRKLTRSATRTGDPRVELLETRVVPATLEFSNGLLDYTAGDGEANRVTVDRVTIGGQSYLRLREAAPVGVSLSGAGLIADGGNVFRVVSSSLTFLSIALGDRDDVASVSLNALPARAILDAGDNTADASPTYDTVTILGTASPDQIAIDPVRASDGWKFARITRDGRVFDFGRFEIATIDISQDGPDSLVVDRSINGPNRPVELRVIGGGLGDDTLSVTAPGIIPQLVSLTDGRVRSEEVSGRSSLLLGRSDNIAIDQPKVQIELIRRDPATGELVSMGPTAFNSFLLDTGATGILATANPTAEMIQEGYRTYSTPYAEQGVSGTTYMDVSLPYRVDFAGYSGERNTLENFQILSSTEVEFSFFGPWGIVGMPAMVNRVTTLDMSRWSNIQDVDDLPLRTEFALAAPPDSGHQYHVPLQLQAFPHTGSPSNPRPTFAPLPFLDVVLREDGREVPGRFLLDTGAQLSIISTRTAIALGLDKDGDGNLEHEALDHIEVSGIGGSTSIPLVAYDRMTVPTSEGVDLIWTDMLAGIVDIDVADDNDPNTPPAPQISGVFGMDFLTSGWASKVLPGLLGTPASPLDGYFRKVHFDFRDAARLRGTMVLDVTPSRDLVGSGPLNPAVFSLTGVDFVSVAGGSADDVFEVTPSPTVPFLVDGGPHATGDVLRLPPGVVATVSGSTLSVAGRQPITFRNIESLPTGGGDTTAPRVTAFQISDDTGQSSSDRITSDTTLSLTLTFSEPITLDPSALSITAPDGSTVVPRSRSGSGTSSLRLELPPLASDGTYRLRLAAPGATDAAGNPLSADYTGSFRLDTRAPVPTIEPVSPDPRFSPIGSITIRFNEPIDGLTLSDLALTRNGGRNLLGASVTLARVDDRTWRLDNLGALTTPVGNYLLTLTAGAVVDVAGNVSGAAVVESFAVERPPALSINNPKVYEGAPGAGGLVRFVVRISRAIDQPVTVSYALQDDTARAGLDFLEIGVGTIRFEPGETSRTIEVSLVGDTAVEPDERFRLVLSDPVNTTLPRSGGVATVRNDDTTISIADVAKFEGNSGTTVFAFQVLLNAAAPFDVSVPISTADGTALAGSDYEALSSTILTFAAGETSKTIVVRVFGDTAFESDETFRVRLGSPTNARLARGSAVGRVLNDDLAALRLAGRPGIPIDPTPTPTASDLRSLRDAAIADWAASGRDARGLRRASIQFADLAGDLLGLTDGRRIWLDTDAAGRGWFVDATPRDDVEFASSARGPSRRRVDLLTVVSHELGHVLGLRDHDGDDAPMSERLAVGRRRRPR